MNSTTKYNLRHFLVSLALALTIFLLIKPKITAALEPDDSTEPIVSAVGSERGNNGFRQIYAVVNGEKTYITSTEYTNDNPKWDGPNIVWMGLKDENWEIFMHNIVSGTITQLTKTGMGNNVNPDISNGQVVWEGQVNNLWQAFYFDGVRVEQLTDASSSIKDIKWDNGNIVYSLISDENWNNYYFDSVAMVSKLIETDLDKKSVSQESSINGVSNFSLEDIKMELNIEKHINQDLDEKTEKNSINTKENITETPETTESTRSIN